MLIFMFRPQDYRVVKSYIECLMNHDFLVDGECNYKCSECQYHHKNDD